jgi:hypothetical protein
MTTDLMEHLLEICRSGGVRQSQEARRLISVLEGAPDDDQAAATAQHLVEAFLHDPYLDRCD